MPSADRAAPAWMRTTRFAHRGLHDLKQRRPENSLAAFAAAIVGGYGIELDVRASRDGEAMVFHDPTLSRLTRARGKVASMTAAALSAIFLKGADDERIPSLRATLEVIAGQAPLLIEMKPDHEGPPIEPAVRRALKGYDGPVAVMSFEAASVAWFADHAPAIWRGLVTKLRPTSVAPPMPVRDSEGRIAAPVAGQPHFFACDIRALARRKVPAEPLPYPLMSWTVRTRGQAARAARFGAALIFEKLRPSARDD